MVNLQNTIRHDSLPPFKPEQFTLTAEQRKWFRLCKKNQIRVVTNDVEMLSCKASVNLCPLYTAVFNFFNCTLYWRKITYELQF
jgi:hypothetical protein